MNSVETRFNLAYLGIILLSIGSLFGSCGAREIKKELGDVKIRIERLEEQKSVDRDFTE